MQDIYLDHAATSPLRPAVAEAMQEAREAGWANPSSPHGPGRRARRLLESARGRIADALGYSTREIYFVRGGTEANNLAIAGVLQAMAEHANGGGRALAISSIEHSSVTRPAEALEALGISLVRLPVSKQGTVSPTAIDGAIRSGVQLFSIQAVNSETGLMLPVEDILDIATERGVPLHVDGVQAAGRIPLPRPAGRPLLLTLSGHKIGGPRGTSILAVPSSVDVTPLLFGGSQERGLRPGTEDVEGAIGFAEALALALDARERETHRLTALREHLEAAVATTIPAVRVHGNEGARAPHILSLGIPGLSSDVLLAAMDLEGVAASAGSACRSGVPGPGSALRALYGVKVEGVAPLRLSLGWNTTAAEVEEACERTVRVILRLLELESAASTSMEDNR